MSQANEFCVFLSIRYLNPLLMGSAHDWIADNIPPIPEGMVQMRSFHIAPDRSTTIIWFNNQEHIDTAFPRMKAFQQQIAERFESSSIARHLLPRMETVMRQAGLDVAAIEFICDADDRPFVYDVNTNTNYNSDAESRAGVSAMDSLAAYLQAELVAERRDAA